ncbi:hypothetical protein AVEN_231120-1 [Araneus ventricosus]|uniref:Uncharacterized protein n=1 Tax=Araneus ventricosus TaxID=182803 RepID=A0A4Y2J7Q6_ARAVE|nr:hypothetical protein AVEN_231120-1 [Araneus ventricosus]
MSNWARVPHIDCPVGCMVSQDCQKPLTALEHGQDQIAQQVLVDSLPLLLQGTSSSRSVVGKVGLRRKLRLPLLDDFTRQRGDTL